MRRMAKPAPKDPTFLSSLAVFGGIPPADLERIAARMEVRSLPAPGELFAEGAAAREMFVVREGELEVTKKNKGSYKRGQPPETSRLTRH